MKFNSAVSLLFVWTILPGLSSAQPPKVKEVEQAVQALTQAMIDADGPTLQRLTSSSLSYGHSSGKIESQAEFVENIVTGGSVFEDIQLEDQTVEVLGNTATVRHTFTAKTNDKGKGPGTVKLHILLVWVKAETGWVLLARQAVKVP